MAFIEKNGRAAWKKRKSAEEREEFARVRSLRAELFELVGYHCVVCAFRMCESIHEEPPRSTGTVPSRETSIPCCGSGTTGCHGLMQSKRIVATRVQSPHLVPLGQYERKVTIRFYDGQEVSWLFSPKHPRAVAHLRGEEVAN
jgi:hypothetical protein